MIHAGRFRHVIGRRALLAAALGTSLGCGSGGHGAGPASEGGAGSVDGGPPVDGGAPADGAAPIDGGAVAVDGGGPPGDATIADAASPSADAQGDGPGDSSPDAHCVAPSGLLTNMPCATVVDVGSPAFPDLRVVNSYFMQTQTSGGYVQQWSGEVQNIGTATHCRVSVHTIAFKDAAGNPATATFQGVTMDADPYLGTGPLTYPCITPGTRGVFIMSVIAASAADIASIHTIEVSYTELTPSTLSPATDVPTVQSVTPAMVQGGRYGVTGTIVGGAGPIYNLEVDFFSRDSSGFILGVVDEIDLNTLDAGETLPFSSTGISIPITNPLQYISFIDGPHP